jgi:hypothetical protein
MYAHRETLWSLRRIGLLVLASVGAFVAYEAGALGRYLIFVLPGVLLSLLVVTRTSRWVRHARLELVVEDLERPEAERAAAWALLGERYKEERRWLDPSFEPDVRDGLREIYTLGARRSSMPGGPSAMAGGAAVHWAIRALERGDTIQDIVRRERNREPLAFP